MIKLNKGPEPKILQDNGVRWAKELMDDFALNNVLNKKLQKKYNHPQVKDAVETETSGKCAYCESNVSHVYPGDIEHIIAKSEVPQKTFLWENLTYCCFECNNKKRAYHDDAYPLINPYIYNIDEHLIPIGPLYFSVRGSTRGELTKININLNREEIVGRRREKIEELQKYILAYHREQVNSLKDEMLLEMEDFIKRSEFSNTLQKVFMQCV